MSDNDPNLDGPPWEEDDVVERDENTDDMFGAPAPAAGPVVAPAPPAPPPVAAVSEDQADDGAAYQVLARKYRPRTFEDLIGQEAMVRTLTNAFATGRIAHAFMLTGVRGVGKTTTARLLARALNNETETIDRPSLTLTAGRHVNGPEETLPRDRDLARHFAGLSDVHRADAAQTARRGGA